MLRRSDLSTFHFEKLHLNSLFTLPHTLHMWHKTGLSPKWTILISSG